MNLSRTVNTTRTFVFGVISKCITILFPFLTRTIIIYKLGAEYVGLTSLFTSVLQILNVSELGISSAISFCLYKPIAENDETTINALIALMRKLYKIIGLIILLVGMVLTPFLSYFISGTYPESMNIYVLYFIYLLNSSVSYLGFAYKGVLFEAFQRGDINHKIISIIEICKYVAQILILLIFADYYWFAAMLPISSIIVTIVTELVSRKKYPNITPHGKVSKELKNTIKGKVLFLSAHSIAATLTNSIDNIVISSALGLVATAIYGNYYYIYSAVTSIAVIAFRAIKPAFGNSLYVDTYEKRLSLFNSIQFLMNWIAMFCSVCLLCLYQPFMTLWVGEKYLVNIWTVVLIVLYFYGNFIKLSFSNIYIDAAGLWNKTLVRQIVVAVINLVLDCALVKNYGIAGIVFASFLATSIVGLPLDVIVTFRYVFKKSAKDGIFGIIKQFIFAVIVSGGCYFICSFIRTEKIWELIFKMVTCLVLPNLIMLLLYRNDERLLFVKNHVYTFIRRKRKL